MEQIVRSIGSQLPKSTLAQVGRATVSDRRPPYTLLNDPIWQPHELLHLTAISPVACNLTFTHGVAATIHQGALHHFASCELRISSKLSSCRTWKTAKAPDQKCLNCDLADGADVPQSRELRMVPRKR